MTQMVDFKDYAELKGEVEDMKALLKVMLMRIGAPSTVKVKDIARIEGVSESSINEKERYLLPRFGVSGYPTGVRRWDLDEYLAWRSKPVEERYRAFQVYNENLRLKAVERMKSDAVV